MLPIVRHGAWGHKLRHLPFLSPFALMASMREAHTQVPEASLSSLSSSAAEGAEAGVEGDDTKDKGILWRLIKTGLFLSCTAAVGGAAYVSYAFDTEQIDSEVATLRSSANLSNSEDMNLLDVARKVGVQRMRRAMYTATVAAAVNAAEMYLDTRKAVEEQIHGFAAPSSSKLLPDLPAHEQNIFTLVLDLNETLVYSDWKRDRGWRTFKRPGVDAFLEQLAQYYELIIYSDQLSFYVEPVLEKLDQKGCIRYRLSRDATQYIHGQHFRDLTKLNRDPSRIIYLSGHAVESSLQPENALPIKPWKLENDDTGLLDLLPFLEFVARQRPADIRPVLASYEGLDIPTEFRERTKGYQRRMQERKQQQSRLWRGPAISPPSS